MASSPPAREKEHAGRTDRRLILTMIAAGVVLGIDVATPVGLAVWLLQVVLVWTASVWADRRQMLAVAIVCSSLIVLGFLFSPKTGLAVSAEICNVAISLVVIGAITHSCLRQRATDDARRKAAEELARSQATVHALSGLLPICAWCKRIRNESGNWEQMEVYIRGHSQAEFTHGICADCAERAGRENNAGSS